MPKRQEEAVLSGSGCLRTFSEAELPGVVSGTVLEEIQKMVAEATGYTIDELEPELELESELGIDTVKQAELLGTIKETFGIPDDVEQELSSLSTLQKLASWVGAHGSASVSGSLDAAGVVEETSTDLLATVTEVLAHETGYEVDELDPELMLEADLGIDTVKQAEVMGILRERFELAQDESLDLSELSTIQKIVHYIAARMGEQPLPPEPGKRGYGVFQPQRINDFSMTRSATQTPSLLSKRVAMVGATTPWLSGSTRARGVWGGG